MKVLFLLLKNIKKYYETLIIKFIYYNYQCIIKHKYFNKYMQQKGYDRRNIILY